MTRKSSGYQPPFEPRPSVRQAGDLPLIYVHDKDEGSLYRCTVERTTELSAWILDYILSLPHCKSQLGFYRSPAVRGTSIEGAIRQRKLDRERSFLLYTCKLLLLNYWTILQYCLASFSLLYYRASGRCQHRDSQSAEGCGQLTRV